MKALIVSLIIWIFLVPGALTIGLTLRSLADFAAPGVVVWVAVACATAAILWTGLWFPDSSRDSIRSSPTSPQNTVPPAQKKNDSRLKVNRPASIH